MNKRLVNLMVALGLAAMTGAAATPDLFDNFDDYAVGQSFTGATNGWETSHAGVMVTNNAARSGAQSVVMPGRTVLTNAVNGGGGKVIWTDLFVKPARGGLPPGASAEGSSLCLYFNDDGFATLVTTSGSVVFSNDVWGTALLPATSDFVRVTAYQDYATSNQAVLIDGRLAAQDLPFVAALDAYHTLSLLNGSSNAWADDVWVKTTHDALTLTNDANANGQSEAGELAAYGYAARTHYIGEGPGQPHYDSFEAAIGAWRARDAVYAHAGIYTNDVVVTNGITLGGAAFTNSGTLTVAAGTAVTFQNGMNWGTVIVGPGAVAVFDEALACSNLVVAAGSTATFHAVACDSVQVETGARATFLGELLCATDCALDLGAAVAFSNAVTCGGTLVLGTNATLVAAEALTCSNLVALAGAAGSFQAVACTNLSAGPGASLAFAGAVDCATFSAEAGSDLAFATAVTCAADGTLGSGSTATFAGAVGCGGAFTVGTGASATLAQALTCVTLAAEAGATVTVHAVTCDDVVAAAGARLTFLGTVACANAITLGPETVAGFSNTVTCGTALLLGTNATVALAQGVACSNLVVSTGAAGTFQAVTCTNLVSEGGAHLTFLGPVACAADVTIGAGAAAGFSNTVACAGTFAVGAGAAVVAGQSVTCGDLTLAVGAIASFQAVSCNSLAIGDGAQAGFAGAVLCATDSTIGAAAVTFEAAVTCGGTWLADAGATVTFGRSATLAVLNVNGSLTLAGGGALAFDSGTVTGVVQVTGSGTVTVTTALAVLNGGRLEFTDSRFRADGVDMTGTFTIDHSLGELAAVAVPFVEDFELYAPGTRLQNLGFRGWGGKDANAVVQSGVAHSGSQAARLQDDTALSNRLATTATHLWTDLYLLPQPGLNRPDLPTNGASFVAFVDTNGWLEVGSDAGWIVCSNLYLNHGTPGLMTTQTWTRVTVFQDFTQQKAAVFLDGKLVREQVPFRDSAVGAYTSVEVNNNAGAAYLDGVRIGTVLPTGLDGDLDGDFCPDGREIDALGSVTVRDDWVRGSWFIFR